MSELKKPVDYKQLEVELQKAIKADELYQLQNDAKLRAVEQNVPSYEHFRQIVNAAHLKPVDRAEIKQKIDTPWNSLVSRFDAESTERLFDTKKKEFEKDTHFDSIGKVIPTTYSDFSTIWNHITDDNIKFAYLYNCKTVLLNKIFRVEISPVLFQELLSVCLECAKMAHRFNEIIEILMILSKCNRFDLTVSFMSTNEKEVCEELFRTLLDKVEAEDHELRSTIASLRVRYKVAVN